MRVEILEEPRHFVGLYLLHSVFINVVNGADEKKNQKSKSIER